MRIYLGKLRIYQFIGFFILNPCFYNDYVLLKQNKYLKLIHAYSVWIHLEGICISQKKYSK
jgi:hypothetical protein